VVITLFGIGFSDNATLRQYTPTILWVVFFLIALLTMENIFRADQETGIMEQWLLSPLPLWWIISAKSLVLWIAACLPLLLIIPLCGLMLSLTFGQIGLLMLSIVVGSPALAWLGMVGAALTMALSRGGVFLGCILLPLYVPVLILGKSAVNAALFSEPIIFPLAMLGAISTLAITLAPYAGAMAVRAAMDA